MLLLCGTLVGEGSEREQCHLLSSRWAFTYFLPYPQANWALLVLISRWVVLCKFKHPVDLSKELSCEAWNSSLCCNPHRVFSHGLWGFISSHWKPGLHGLSRSPGVPPGLSACKCVTAHSASHHLAPCPLYPSCPSLPLQPIWMNVSSLTHWLLDFHTVWFSGSFGYFLVSFHFVCCPSFVWERRQSISTYASILAGSPK